MTALYRPVLIESSEQAEALPLFTIATIEDSPATGYPEVARKIVNGWRNRDLIDGRIPHAEMIGWTALVPIEAEPEYAVRLGPEGGMVLPIGTRDPAPGHGGVDNLPRQRRLVTPWEAA